LEAIPIEEAKKIISAGHSDSVAATIEEQSMFDCVGGSCEVRTINENFPVEQGLVYVG